MTRLTRVAALAVALVGAACGNDDGVKKQDAAVVLDAAGVLDAGAGPDTARDTAGATPDAAAPDAAGDVMATDTSTPDAPSLPDASAPDAGIDASDDAAPPADASQPDAEPADASHDAVAMCGKIACDCTFKGKKLHGRYTVVTAFPDFKVRETAFPDLKVELVTGLASTCGKWERNDTFPEFKVQIVTAFEDFAIQYVKAFPGVAKPPN
jgi:hypothetical protein